MAGAVAGPCSATGKPAYIRIERCQVLFEALHLYMSGGGKRAGIPYLVDPVEWIREADFYNLPAEALPVHFSLRACALQALQGTIDSITAHLLERATAGFNDASFLLYCHVSEGAQAASRLNVIAVPVSYGYPAERASLPGSVWDYGSEGALRQKEIVGLHFERPIEGYADRPMRVMEVTWVYDGMLGYSSYPFLPSAPPIPTAYDSWKAS
ncbi:hypothetical protein WJX81_005241 [Elliptochloris bilobata]|uniref:Uncharacterized protein n=1 Tax=Elliptochloris bilobata TaxID=381761 RepID=A0AAW1RQQ7_9CHLO